jgi:hypothetical protein
MRADGIFVEHANQGLRDICGQQLSPVSPFFVIPSGDKETHFFAEGARTVIKMCVSARMVFGTFN